MLWIMEMLVYLIKEHWFIFVVLLIAAFASRLTT